ncbi:MAG: YdcF family protein [Ramlibacter sp.]
MFCQWDKSRSLRIRAMLPGELKPILAALLLPPAGPLLLGLLGLLLMGKRWLAGALVSLVAITSLWFISCHAVGVGLARTLLPQVKPLNATSAAMADVQAIVILGGGLKPQAPEYGRAQPSPVTLERIRYGAWLARQTGKPLAFAGGTGWGAAIGTHAEADVARNVLRDDYRLELKWADGRSRDTAENATLTAAAMRGDRIHRIALVTNAWHMPRARAAYEKAGFQVTPAPIGFAAPRERVLLEWLPSAHGLELSRQVLREWVALRASPG